MRWSWQGTTWQSPGLPRLWSIALNVCVCDFSLSPSCSPFLRIRERDFNDMQQFKQNDSQRWDWYFWWLPDKVKTLTSEWKRTWGAGRGRKDHMQALVERGFFLFLSCMITNYPWLLFLTSWTMHLWNFDCSILFVCAALGIHLVGALTIRGGKSLVVTQDLSDDCNVWHRYVFVCQWRGFLLHAAELAQCKARVDLRGKVVEVEREQSKDSRDSLIRPWTSESLGYYGTIFFIVSLL